MAGSRRTRLMGLAVALAVTATAGLTAGTSRAAVADPSGLQLLRTVEAGHQTTPNTGANGAPFQDDTTIEPSITVNPANPLEIVTGTQTGRDDAGGDINNGFATSHDGGLTWVSGAMPGLTATSGNAQYTRASDAVVAWGPGETVYYSSLVFDPNGTNTLSAILNSTSHDGGLTWDMPTTVQSDQGGGLNDKNWTAVDLGKGAGHHYGRIYVVWDRVAGIITKYSDDGGLTWVPPSPVIAPLTFQGQGIGSLPMIEPNGDLAIAFESGTFISTSTPGEDLGEAVNGMTVFALAVAAGAGNTTTGLPLTFNQPVQVAAYMGNPVRGQRAGSLLDSATDAKTGEIYVTFEDSRFRTDSNNDVVISHSTDEGKTWSAPARVNGGPTTDQVDHYDSSVDVGPDSSVRVMWRQRQETASADVSTFAPYVSTWVAQSTDGGATFLPPLQVDRRNNDVRFGAFSRNGAFQGDYDEIVTLGQVSYLVYCDSWAVNGETPPATPGDATVHHQRTIVSIIEPASVGTPAVAPVAAPVAAPAAPVVKAKPVTHKKQAVTRKKAVKKVVKAKQPSGTLAYTGGRAIVPLTATLLLLAAFGLLRKRRRRSLS